MITNAELEAAGLTEEQMRAYWAHKTAQQSHNIADADKANIRAQYQQDMTDLQTIIDTVNPTNAQVIWAVKKLASIMKDVFLYHKDEVQS